MKLSLHKNIDGFLDYIAIVPENQVEKNQLNKIAHASAASIVTHDLTIPESYQYAVEIEIKLTTKYQ